MWLAWLVAYELVGNDYVLPSFFEAAGECGRLLADAAFWRAFGGTLLRTALSFLCALVGGVGLALIANLRTWVRAFLSPIVSVLRTVPTMAVILMLLLWTSPTVAPAVVSVLVLLPAFYAAALASLDEVGEEYGALVRVYKVSTARKVFKLYAPLSAPAVLAQSGSIFSMGLKITVSGEVLSNTYRSLGGMMQEAKMFLEMPTLMALTLLCLVTGFILEGGCLLLSRVLVRWRR